MVDNPPGQNRGLYRVGKGIAADGTAAGGWIDCAGGWIDWMEGPHWFPFENQYGGVAVADLDGDGRPELIVLMADNPRRRTRASTGSAASSTGSAASSTRTAP